MYLSQRSIEILKELIYTTESSIDLDELSNRFNMSERSIRYDLENIDAFLKQKGLPELNKRTRIELSLNDEKIDNETKNSLLRDIETVNVYLTPQERREWLFIELLFQPVLIDIQYLMDRLQVSRSTAIADMRRLKTDLKEKNIHVQYTVQTGYVVRGSEHAIRRYGINVISNSRSLRSYVEESILGNEWLFFHSEDFQFVEELVTELEGQLKKTYSGDAFGNIVLSVLLLISRMKQNQFLAFQERIEPPKSKEYVLLAEKAKLMEEHFALTIPNQEIWFLANLFLEGNLIKSDSFLDENWVDLYLFIHQFIEDMNQKLNVQLNQDPELFNALVLHLGPALTRLENDIFLKNEIIQYIEETYSDLFEKVGESLKRLIKERDVVFSADEIGFVTLHIASALEKLSIQKREPNTLIICNYGIGTSKLLETRIKKYSALNVKGTFAKRELSDAILAQHDIDLIISTVPLKNEYFTPVIEVSPLLNEQEIKKIKEFELNYMDQLAPVHHLDLNVPQLEDLLTEETIATNVEARSWEEAVQLGGELLEKKGVIRHEYIEKMIAAVRESGPYIVIAPNIAMPHAGIEDGVKDIGLSLITLKNPVTFGTTELVKIVICLAAVDRTSHLHALQDLINFLDDETFLHLLKSEPSSKRIAEFLKNKQ